MMFKPILYLIISIIGWFIYFNITNTDYSYYFIAVAATWYCLMSIDLIIMLYEICALSKKRMKNIKQKYTGG